MFGVVLWSNEADTKAVIWCEDHGRLAFYSATKEGACEDVPLDAGDLIRFDLKEDHSLRYAHNLRRVAQAEFPTLQSDVASFRHDFVVDILKFEKKPANQGGECNLVEFEPHAQQCKRNMIA